MKHFLFILGMLCWLMPLRAQNADAAKMAKDANNPLASITTVSLQNTYTPSLYGYSGTMNATWLRCVQPIGRMLIRASMPFNTVDANSIRQSGFGDLNIFATYILTKPSATSQFGVGPIFTIPTASDRALGGGKWQAGVAIAAYFAENNVFQMGLLATWQHSFAGKSDRNKVQVASIQPFFMWQLGKGTYLRSTAINIMDFENGIYAFPMGAGIGKVLKANKLIFNIFIEPQFTIWHQGAGVPQMQILMGVNTQF